MDRCSWPIALNQLLVLAARNDIDASRGPAHVVPAPTSQATSPVDFRDTPRLIDGATGSPSGGWPATRRRWAAASNGSVAGIRRCARVLLIIAGVAVIGIATSPEPASGPTARHLAWTVLGAVTITVWPVFVARRGPARPQILSVSGSVAVTVAFVTLLGWFFAEAQGGSMLGLAERVTTSVEASWPLVVAVALRRSAAHAWIPQLL
jgi:Protein of unknown function (DUF998)